MYVNIEDTNQVVEIDCLSARELRRFSLKPCEEPTGMGLDPEHHKVFSGCYNRIMTVLDLQAGKVITTLPIGAQVDGNGFVFSSNGDGTLTVVREASPGTFAVAETVATQRGSRTMAIDPKPHAIYLPGAQFSQPGGPGQRPEMVKDSFEVLVVGK